MATAYCVKCRDKREIKDPVETQLKMADLLWKVLVLNVELMFFE